MLAIQRVVGIYQTARTGRIGQPLATQIWNVLLPLYNLAVGGGLPPNQAAYDQLVVNTALQIQNILLPQGRGGFGVGQKMVNLFMKDLWGLGVITLPAEALLHAPLDRIVLSKVQNMPGTWSSWTKVVAPASTSSVVCDYLAIQDRLRAFQAGCPIAFASVIQMEQFIWHRI